MKQFVKLGTQDYTVVVFIQDSSSTTGAGLTGLDDTKVDAYYCVVNTDNDIEKGDVAIADLAAITDAHSDGGFIEIDATNLPGFYRLDLPDALFAAGNWSSAVRIYDAGDNDVADCTLEFQLVAFDPTDGVRLGMTALPNAAADAAGGLPISDAGGLDLDSVLSGNTPQTGDSYARIGAPVGESISADIALVQTTATQNGVDIGVVDGIVDAILVDTDSTIPGVIATAQADLDILTGSDGVTLATSQPNYAPATATALATAQTDLDTLTGSDGVTLATSQPNYAPATATALATAQTDLDTLTGSDGVTLATSQPNYAPATAAALATAQTELDKIGTIPALDGATQTIGAAIAKLADDNGGASYDAETDSLNAIAADLASFEDVNVSAGMVEANVINVEGSDATDQITSACNQSLIAYNLDHLLAVADSDDVVDDSVVAKLASKGGTADWTTYVNTTDALEATADAAAAILSDTGTDGVVLSAAQMNKIADHVIRRTFENACDSSDGDTKAYRSLLGAIAKLVNKLAITDSTLTIYEDDDTTALGTQTVTTSASADPITALDTD